MRILRSILAAIVIAAMPATAQQVTLACASTDTIIVSRAQTAAVCAAKANAPPPVVIAPAPIGGAIEPAGMTRLFDFGFSTLDTIGWRRYDGYAGASQLAADPSAVRSAAGVIQQNFTSRLAGGSSPSNFELVFSARRTIYAALWLKLSSNWIGHATGVNKVLHFWQENGQNTAVLVIRGAGTGTLRASFGFQGIASAYAFDGGITGTTGNLDANLASCIVSRAQWHRYEIVLTNSTPGVADGSVEFWLDGVLCRRALAMPIARAGTPGRWQIVQWSPTWGGTGGAISTTQTMSADHLYLSGK